MAAINRRCATCGRGAQQDGEGRWHCPNGHKKLRWSAKVTISAPGEKRRQVSRSFDRKEDAEQWAAKQTVDRVHGDRVEPPKQTLGEYLDDWLGSLGVQQLEANTISWYRSAVQRHIKPELGGVRLQALTPTMIEAFLAEKAEKGRLDGKGGLGPTSVRRLYVTLHKALDGAVRRRLIRSNPVDLADKPKVPEKDVTEDVWAPETVTLFLEATRGDRLYALWQAAAMTGLRREELAGLWWSDVDIESGVLSVRRARTLVDGRSVLKGPKTATSRRTVDLDAGTVAALREWRRVQLEERLRAGDAWEAGEWVFTDELGRPWRPDTLTRKFVRAVKATGLPETDIKGLRHAHATALLKAGVAPKVVQERLGHASISITMDIYTSVLPNMQRAAIDRLAAMMQGGSRGM